MAVPDTCLELSEEERRALVVERREEDLAARLRAADSLMGTVALLGGRDVALELRDRRNRVALTAQQAMLLRADAASEVAQYRWSVVRDAAGRPVASTEAVVLLHRLPYAAAAQLSRTEEPLGRVLRPWGMRRHVQGQPCEISATDLAGEELSLEVTAVLDLGTGRSVALVRERLYAEWVDAFYHRPGGLAW
ncbi:hypothetical protein GCM10012275_43160 [Longimycelium tulufanense]|uniref:Uncharacterized protein n=1 Tax=Longimycelium tulufanense TaxID=907463 RepID=A0A8J3FXG6_9PSEU|nr:hypothetical protein [Longimycelium tulufanense]GGM67954.1 hypothetical protein GCM10012275_43160 [Longimycelium tulufanense]